MDFLGVLREKGRMVTDHDVVPRLGPTLQFPLKREGGLEVDPASGLLSELQSV